MRCFIAFLFAVSVAAVISLATGCAATPVQTRLANIQGKADAITRSATDIQTHAGKITGAENKPHVDAINKDAGRIVIDAKGIRFESKEAVAADQQTQQELQSYKTNPLVWVAMFVWRWLKVFVVLGVVFVALYPLSFVLGLFNPASAAWRLGQGLIRLLPAANPVRWAHEVLGKKTVAVPAAVVPVVDAPAAVITQN